MTGAPTSPAIVTRHTTMPQRSQATPHGTVMLSSRWMRDHYLLVASGPREALIWMFPSMTAQPELNGASFRHVFTPAPHRITVERDLRRACAAWQAQWTQRFQDEPPGSVPTSSATHTIRSVGDLFDHLYEKRKTTIARSTTDRDRYRLGLWRTELGNETALTQLTCDHIQAALTRISKRTSPSTANTSLGVLKTYLTWGANMGLLRDFSHRTVRRLKEPPALRHQRAWWTSDEVELALRYACEDPHQPTATLLVACGCYLGQRVEEIIMQRWQDMDLDSVDPRTGEPKPVCHVTPNNGWQPKDGEARDIPICAPLLVILKRHRRSEGFLLEAEPHRPGRRRDGKGWVYRYDPKKVWARIMRQLVAAGGKAITMGAMRHCFASNLLIAGVSDVKVSRWLGHADTRMVHRHYGHLLSYDDDINALRRPALAPS